MLKRQSWHSNFKSVENIIGRNKNHKTYAKKYLFFFGSYLKVSTFQASFTKYNLNKLQAVSVITHWTYTCLNPSALKIYLKAKLEHFKLLPPWTAL